MKKLIIISFLLQAVATSISAQQTDFPKLTGSYLGQKPPGITQEHIVVGIIDNDERVFDITFSLDGRECFFTKSLTTNTIMTTRDIIVRRIPSEKSRCRRDRKFNH